MQVVSFVGVRLENIDARFSEIDTLLNLAKQYKMDAEKYSALCRSAHVLLVSHVEGIYKDIVKDIIDDLNNNTEFNSIPLSIFRTFSIDFTNPKSDDDKFNEVLKDKLKLICNDYKTKLNHHPFLRVDNKNPTAKILEEILKKFGEKDFFKSLSNSRLEIVFQNNMKASLKELERIKKYIKKGTLTYPYLVDKSYYYNSNFQTNSTKRKGLFEEFLEEFLKDRHAIVHGNVIKNPTNDFEIFTSKLKIEILIYAFILCLCSNSNPTYFLTTNEEY